MIGHIKELFFKYCKFSVMDTIFSFFMFAGTIVLCLILRLIDNGLEYVSMIFLLTVFIISTYTSGYFYGTLASLLAVLAVNYIFTYPYLQFNFILPGYPITATSMLVVSIITSTLIAQIREHEDIRIEAEKEKMRGNLLRAISHDLRTPLTSILGASSVIIDNDNVLTSNDRIKLATEIKDEAQWLISMVENLLSVTRIDSELSTNINKRLEICEELVADSLTKFKKRFPSANVQVSVPEELLMVNMDAILIEQVIINLLENAVKHAKGATLIKLSVKKDGDHAIFTVEDNGEGIEKKVLPHIFDGYLYQVKHDSIDSQRNSGIGLSVCDTIIKAHNGTLSAQNKKEGGAMFSFSLPLEEDINE